MDLNASYAEIQYSIVLLIGFRGHDCNVWICCSLPRTAGKHRQSDTSHGMGAINRQELYAIQLLEAAVAGGDNLVF